MRANITFPVLLILILVACHQEKPKIKSDDEKMMEKREQSILAIANKYNASIALDTVRYKLTYQYQNLLKQNNRLIIDGFRVDDIVKTDSIIIIKIEMGGYRKLFFDLYCNKAQFDTFYPSILKTESTNFRVDNTFLIANISDVKKVRLSLSSYNDENGEEDLTTHVKLERSEDFILKGTLVDIYFEPE